MFLNDFGFITSIKAKPLMLIRAYTDIGTFDLSMSVNERKNIYQRHSVKWRIHVHDK